MQNANTLFSVTIDLDGDGPETMFLTEPQVLKLVSLGANAMLNDYMGGTPAITTENETSFGYIELLTPDKPVVVDGVEYSPFHAGEFLSRGIIETLMERVSRVEARHGLAG